MWKLVSLVAAAAVLGGGSAQGAASAAPANTSPPTVSGPARAGELLTASSGSWSGSGPITFSYRWLRCNSSGDNCSRISGATSQTYRLVKGDAGRRLRISVTARNSDGSAEATSSATDVVESGKSPESTSPPAIAGDLRAGQTLTSTPGSWNNNPTSFAYQWFRCNAGGGGCDGIGSNRPAFTLRTAEVGSTIRVRVRARNEFGSTDATSAPTGLVAPAGPPPVNTAPPTIAGTLREGQTLTATSGSWTNAPTRFDYQWRRCDTAGNNCEDFGSDGQTQILSSSEVGHSIVVGVRATNQYGYAGALSRPTAAVAPASGVFAIPVEQVSPPQRLLISAASFSPRRLTSRAPFVARFRVSGTRGNLVRGALVYALALPYGWIRPAAEVATGSDGWATIQFFPTRAMPLRRGAVVFFVRARKPGDSLLAGVSTRRLVQLSIG
jgi:hypothetical protein